MEAQEVAVNPKIDASWLAVLNDEFKDDYFLKLKQFIIEERKSHVVYPPARHIFKAFDLTPFEHVKVVILGQDPYHGPGQAHGLSFSVEQGVQIPPSLRNIYKEIHSDLGHPIPNSGDLSNWANQGVLLLNATLTVRHKSAGSHQKKGWERFTDAAIKAISEKRENVVFMLWGNYARAKKKLIDSEKHIILESAHPSPLSAHAGFLGSKHFSKANAYLEAHHIDLVDWSITD